MVQLCAHVACRRLAAGACPGSPVSWKAASYLGSPVAVHSSSTQAPDASLPQQDSIQSQAQHGSPSRIKSASFKNDDQQLGSGGWQLNDVASAVYEHNFHEPHSHQHAELEAYNTLGTSASTTATAGDTFYKQASSIRDQPAFSNQRWQRPASAAAAQQATDTPYPELASTHMDESHDVAWLQNTAEADVLAIQRSYLDTHTSVVDTGSHHVVIPTSSSGLHPDLQYTQDGLTVDRPSSLSQQQHLAQQQRSSNSAVCSPRSQSAACHSPTPPRQPAVYSPISPLRASWPPVGGSDASPLGLQGLGVLGDTQALRPTCASGGRGISASPQQPKGSLVFNDWQQEQHEQQEQQELPARDVFKAADYQAWREQEETRSASWIHAATAAHT